MKIRFLMCVVFLFMSCEQELLSKMKKESETPTKELYENWESSIEKLDRSHVSGGHFLLGTMAYQLYQEQKKKSQDKTSEKDKTNWLGKAESEFLRVAELDSPWKTDGQYNLEIVRKLINKDQNQEDKQNPQDNKDQNEKQDQKDQKKDSDNKDKNNPQKKNQDQNKQDPKNNDDKSKGQKENQTQNGEEGPKDLSSALKEKEQKKSDELSQALLQEAKRIEEKTKENAQPGQWQGVEKDW